jgi:hypothetical protein
MLFLTMPADPITIHNFRNELDESVLERGWIYFNNNWVKVPREVMPGILKPSLKKLIRMPFHFRLMKTEYSQIYFAPAEISNMKYAVTWLQ